jgi:N-acetylglucosaminyl-diphospho-decaprenol L-rhamnosyltransferase
MDVSIVIPVFNQAPYTQMCLDRLRGAGFPDSRVVVVNNASTDDTAACLAARPQLHVIHNSENLFCRAWNQGARAAGPATWTMILNNDVLVTPGWLEGLTSFAEQEGFDVVSPAICEGAHDYDLAAHAKRFVAKMAGVRRSGIACGACFMVHRRVFDAIGYFVDDPQLGGYLDDEFFRRCRQHGFRLAFTGRSFLHHFGSITIKAVQSSMPQPDAILGDRFYYRRKFGRSWLKRHEEKWFNQFMSARWRWTERLRYGCTLISRRQGGAFVWR